MDTGVPKSTAAPSIRFPFPALSPGEVLTPEQWAILLSILDTFVPSITSSDTDAKSQLQVNGSEIAEAIKLIQNILPPSTDPSIVAGYLAESGVDIEGFRSTVERGFAKSVPADQLKGLRMILSSLNSTVGSLLMIGSTIPFHQHSPAAREKILIGWSKSYIPILRGLFRSFSVLAIQTWMLLSPSYRQVIGMPGVPKDVKRGQDYPYEFLDFSSRDAMSSIEADVIIVGSGCGAGICAKNLSEAGFSVIVVEKGRHFPSSHFPMPKRDGLTHLMESGGSLVSDDASTVFLAGSTFGGGGTVNWSASLQTQNFVRQEWADQGLPFFTSPEFQSCLDKVCGDIGASTKGIRHNFANRVLLEGSRRLGHAVKEVPQNTSGKDHYCGVCTYGCMGTTKNGPAVALFPAAAKAGAKFIQGFDVRKVEFEEKDGKKRASGVVGNWNGSDSTEPREISIKAKRVIVCGGTLNSPLILLRSGLTNPHLGKNLHVHPASFMCAKFDEVTNPWEGGTLTAVNTSLDQLHPTPHGVKIECTAGLPELFASSLPFSTSSLLPNHPLITSPALALKTRAAQFSHFIGFVVFARDRDTGSVYPDPTDGRLRIKYTTSAFDSGNLLEGLIAAAKIAYAGGAREVFGQHPDLEPYVRGKGEGERVGDEDGDEEGGDEEGGRRAFPDINYPRFQAWLAKMRRLGLHTPDPCMLGSAHQMGTCRMGKSAREGVVDVRGRVFGFGPDANADNDVRAGGSGSGTGSLYVADASTFPSASGVNPMVTTMAIAEAVSRGIVREEKRKGKKGGGRA